MMLGIKKIEFAQFREKKKNLLNFLNFAAAILRIRNLPLFFMASFFPAPKQNNKYAIGRRRRKKPRRVWNVVVWKLEPTKLEQKERERRFSFLILDLSSLLTFFFVHDVDLQQ